MIKITNEHTQLEANLFNIDSPIRRIEKRTAANIQDLNQSFSSFWGLPDDQIDEILAFHGIEGITKIFTAHAEYAAAFNKLLEERGIPSPRASVERPRELFVNELGSLQVVPLPPPEPIEDPPISPEIPEV